MGAMCTKALTAWLKIFSMLKMVPFCVSKIDVIIEWSFSDNFKTSVC